MSSSWFSNASHPRLRRAAVAIAGLAALFVGALVTAHLILDTAFFEARLNQRLNQSTNGLYEADIGRVNLSIFLQSLEADNVAVRPKSSVLKRLQQTDSLPGTRFEAQVPSLNIRNINYWTLLQRGGVQLDSLIVQTPRVTITSQSKTGSARQDSTARSLTTRINEAFPFVAMKRLAVRNGTVSMEGSRSGRMRGLTLTLEDLEIDSTALQDTSRVLFSENLELTVDRYRNHFRDSLYRFQVSSLHGSSRTRSMRIGSINLDPTLPDSVFVRSLGERDPRHKIDIGPVTLEAVDYRTLTQHRALDVGTIVLDSALFDVYGDRRVPKVPEPPPKMPHELFQSIRFPVDIDTLDIRGGTVRYTADVEHSHREAKLIFDLQSGQITNITNDPEQMSPSEPMITRATSFINGTGPLYVTMTFPLLSPDFSMEFRGAMPQMNPSVLNDVLLPMQGMRITEGTIDSLWFNGRVNGGVARGDFHAIYRDLHVEMLDQEEQRQQLSDAIKTFVLNQALLKENNLPSGEGSSRVGAIEHEHVQEDSFFKFLWKSLRTGIYSLIGL